MRILTSLCAKPARLVIGLMSGTSADGVDAALCRIHGSGTDTRVELLAFVCRPYPAQVRERLLALAGGEAGGSRELLWMGVLLGRLLPQPAWRSAGPRALLPKRWTWRAATGTLCGSSPRRRRTWACP